MGGIYMLGMQPGTVLSGNVIHNVSADPGECGYGGWGIYLDEGSSYMTIEKNLVFCCGNPGLNIHYGRNNIFKNNISAFNSDGQVSVGLLDEPITGTFIGNIFLTTDGAPIYVNMRDKDHFYDNGNIMWDLANGSSLLFCEKGIENSADNLKNATSLGYIHNPVVRDPLFADPLCYDFTICKDSPALAIGFTAWNYDDAGTQPETIVGLSHAGGLTGYADSAKAVKIIPAHEKTIFEYIKSFFENIFNRFVKLFTK